MRALVFIIIGCCVGAAASAGEECKTPDVEAVQRVLNQQATAIIMLRQQYQEQQRTIEDLKRRLWNTMNRQQA